MAHQCSSIAEALRRVPVVIDHQDAEPGLARTARRSVDSLGCCRSSLAARRPAASGPMNSLPLAGALAVAATLPPCSSTRLLHQGQADAQAALRPVERPVRLGEQLEDVRQHLGGDADARVADPQRPPRPPLRPAVSSIRPPASVYLAALFSRLARTCSSRVGSASSRGGSGGERDRQVVRRWPRSAGGPSRRPGRPPPPGPPAPSAAGSCPA